MFKRFLFSCVVMLVFVGCSINPLPVSLTMSATPENITIRQGESKTIDITIDVELIEDNLDFDYSLDNANYIDEIDTLSFLTLTSNDIVDCQKPLESSNRIACKYLGNKRSNFTISLTLTVEAKEGLDVGNYIIPLNASATSKDWNPVRLINFESELGSTYDSHSINIEIVAP